MSQRCHSAANELMAQWEAATLELGASGGSRLMKPRRPEIRARAARAVVAGLALLALAATSCSSSDESGSSETGGESPSTSTVDVTRTAEGAAPTSTTVQETTTTTVDPATITDPTRQIDVSELGVDSIPEGAGAAQRSASAPDARVPLPSGYTESEYLLSGTANLYTGPATGPATVESEDHPFTTRILVRIPTSPGDFSGRVWIEPFNTSGGGELDAVWSSVAPLLEARGDAWIGMTVRSNQVGRLQEFDPVRYADLDLDENGYTWDALRSLGTLVTLNPTHSPLNGYDVETLYLSGYSQSAVDSSTFAAAFNELTRLGDGSPVYDGYFLGAHDAAMTPLQSGESIIPAFEAAGMPPVDVPVMDFEPQTDVEGFSVGIPTVLARQEGIAGAEEEESDTFPYVNVGGAAVRRANSDEPTDRYWLLEIAAAPHGPGGGDNCDGSSSFPTPYFTRAAAALLVAWTEDGATPPDADRIELATLDDVSVAATDGNGNALGGVRSPFVDVPLSSYAVHSGPAPTCKLTGEETDLSRDVLSDLYGDPASYMEQFTESLDATIEAGFLLELDRQDILETQEERAKELLGDDAD